VSQRCSILWFTGLSGSGKSTIAEGACTRLTGQGKRTMVIDGDDVRQTLHRSLGFSPEDIKENNRLIMKLCRQHEAAAEIILVPIISPFKESRVKARRFLGTAFHEIYVKCSLRQVMQRDTKGLYQRALSGDLLHCVGVDPMVPYEAPEQPELTIETDRVDTVAAIELLMAYIHKQEV
jgi:adenylyl-sulfate kinase